MPDWRTRITLAATKTQCSQKKKKTQKNKKVGKEYDHWIRGPGSILQGQSWKGSGWLSERIKC